MEAHERDGFQRRDPLAVDAHGFRQNDNKGDLADFARLHVEGHARQMDPAALAGGTGDTEGDDQQHQQQIEDEQQIAALGEDVDVQQGKEEIEHDAQQQGKGLDEYIAGVAVVVCGACNDHDAEAGGEHAQKQQEQIALAEKVPDGLSQFLHRPASFQIIAARRSRTGCRRTVCMLF